MQNDLLQLLSERGYINQVTDLDALSKRLNDLSGQGPLPAYIGYDATAPSLHVGSLISIMLLRWYQKFGHKPIVLMGGGTTKVGDPSGKDSARQLLDDQRIDQNIQGIKQVFSKFLQFGEKPNDAVMVNNAQWLDGLNYIEFLRDYGRHFSINRMLSFDSVKLRLEREQTLSFLEFNYMILQAYDFLELSRRYGCFLQMGGSDQWGNIVNGIELARRVDNQSLYGLTTPLLTTSSGAKMGKSADGAIWLNQDSLSSYDYWQFWRNVEDADVGRFLKLFTELPLLEIEKLSQLQGQDLNEAKKILADEACALCHGKEAAQTARKIAEETFELGYASHDLPTHWIKLEQFNADQQIGILNFLVITGFSSSNSEARRLIEQGGVKINQHVITDPKSHLSINQFQQESGLQLSIGRKKHLLVKLDSRQI